MSLGRVQSDPPGICWRASYFIAVPTWNKGIGFAYSPLVHQEILRGMADERWKFQDPWFSRFRLSALSCPRTVLLKWTESTGCWKQKHTEARKCVCVCEHETWVWNRDRGNRDANSGREEKKSPDNSEGQPQEDSHANCLVCWSGSGDWEKTIQNKNGKIPNEFEYIEKRLTCMRKSSQLD